MFATLKQIFNRKNKDLQKKILFTFAALFVFKLGTAIIVPGIDKDALTGDLGFLELLNAMGGGALGQFSILALGVMPYISASLAIQVLAAADVVPYLSDLNKQGAVGKNKMNQITRVAGIIFAFIYGIVYCSSRLSLSGAMTDYVQYSLIMTAGTCFLLWLGDQITAKGIGNGISLLIMAGIVANLPTMFMTAFNHVVTLGGSVQQVALGITMFTLFVIIYMAILVGIIFEEMIERRIPVQYANKSTSSGGGNKSYIPFKLNSSGVMPVIMASTLTALVAGGLNLLKIDSVTLFVSKYIAMNTPTGLLIYIALIFVFTYVWTYMQLKPDQLADNLNKNGGFIPGVRPGKETEKYVSTLLKKLTFVGAASLSLIAALPLLFGMLTNMPSSVTIGGTGLLIVVGVVLETYKQIESQLMNRTYTRGRRK